MTQHYIGKFSANGNYYNKHYIHKNGQTTGKFVSIWWINKMQIKMAFFTYQLGI